MWLHPINTGPGDQVGEGLKSQAICEKCKYEEFSEKAPDEILKEYGIGD